MNQIAEHANNASTTGDPAGSVFCCKTAATACWSEPDSPGSVRGEYQPHAPRHAYSFLGGIRILFLCIPSYSSQDSLSMGSMHNRTLQRPCFCLSGNHDLPDQGQKLSE